METKVSNVTELSTFLTKVSDSYKDNNQLIFSVKTQLDVINSIGSFELASYSINNILDLLRININNTANEKEQNFYQAQAADMIQSIFFFSKAKLILLENEGRNAAKQVIEQATNFLLKGLDFVINTCKNSVLAIQGSSNVPATIVSSLKSSITSKLKDTIKKILKNQKLSSVKFV